MKRVLILPDKAEAEILLEELAQGFKANKCLTMKKSLKDFSTKDLKTFKPDLILGYKYSFLKDKKITDVIKQSDCKKLISICFDENKRDLKLEENLKQIYNPIKLKFLCLVPAVNHIKFLNEFSGYKYCISFLGSPTLRSNLETLCNLTKTYKNKISIFAKEKEFLKSIEIIKEKNLLNEEEIKSYSKSYKKYPKNKEDAAKIYNSSKINLKLDLENKNQPKSNPDRQTLEILASGGFLLAHENQNMKIYFESSKQLETFKNISDLIDKIDFYLNNPKIAQKIAQLGQFEVVKKHTFSARARSILAKTAA